MAFPHGYLTHEQVARLAAECGRYGDVVLFLAYTGIRWREMAALQVGRLDMLRRRVDVDWPELNVKANPSFPKITPLDLRHTAASLAVSAGANLNAEQRMLGHASAAMTLDVYADHSDDDLDAVLIALD